MVRVLHWGADCGADYTAYTASGAVSWTALWILDLDMISLLFEREILVSTAAPPHPATAPNDEQPGRKH